MTYLVNYEQVSQYVLANFMMEAGELWQGMIEVTFRLVHRSYSNTAMGPILPDITGHALIDDEPDTEVYVFEMTGPQLTIHAEERLKTMLKELMLRMDYS